MPRAAPHSKQTPKPRPRTYTEQQKRRALELYDSMSVSELSRKLKIPKSTLGVWAAKAGKKSKRADRVEAAVRTRQADFAKRRAVLAGRLLSDAEKLREQLWKPCTVYKIGGKDNELTEEIVSEPDPKDKQHLLLACGIALTKHVELERLDTRDDETTALLEWLRAVRGEK